MTSSDPYAHIQVLGANLLNVIAGFGSFGTLGNRIMIEEGLGSAGPDGMLLIEPERWYPLRGNLRALTRLERDFGELVLRQAAAAVPKNAPFPPSITDVHTALQSVDVAYHMNHAVDGVPMFSAATGAMTEGIGHYACASQPGRREIRCECTAPYPCVFDRGLLLAMAQRFEPTATLTHLEPEQCRARGAPRCTYAISWK